MPSDPRFISASPYQADVMALPVTDLDTASKWYSQAFGMHEVERRDQPHPTVVLERDGVQIRFATNGGDASQDGAAIQVSNLQALKAQLKANGAEPGDSRIDERDGKQLQVFFVVAPDGLCYYFYEPLV